MDQTKVLLSEPELPLARRRYNLRFDVPIPPQRVLHPGTGERVGPDDFAPLFPTERTLQDVMTWRSRRGDGARPARDRGTAGAGLKSADWGR